MDLSLFSNTPTVTTCCSRRHRVRDLAWYRHPATPGVTDVRVTRHVRDPRGLLRQSIDPRLYDAGRVNVEWLRDLAGRPIRTASADAGTSLSIADTAGRPLLHVPTPGARLTSRYEDTALPGRLIAVAEQAAGGAEHDIERLAYADRSAGYRAVNLAGACVSYQDSAGLLQTECATLTGAASRVTRLLMDEAEDPACRLSAEAFITQTVMDATGAELDATVAGGHIRRVRYDVAGRPAACTVRVAGGAEQVTVRAVTYDAIGQALREDHGSGVVTVHGREKRTQRLASIRTARPVGHAHGASLLQDLAWRYDPAGNVVTISDGAQARCFWRSRCVLPESRYIYDTLGQLVRATGREMADAGRQDCGRAALPSGSGAYTNYLREYDYDRGGNLTQIRHSAAATKNAYTTVIAVSAGSNRGVLSALAAGPGGTEGQFTAGGQQTALYPGQRLCWTVRGGLRAVTPVVRDGDASDSESYHYDAAGRRILKVSVQKTRGGVLARRVVYLTGVEYRRALYGEEATTQLTVVDASGGAGAVRAEVLWRGEGCGEAVRYSHDGLAGSTGLEVDGEGRVVSREEYYPYGGTAVWLAQGEGVSGDRTVRYSGRERDATGLYYYGQRYYQPWAGRWLSADPAGTADGLNLYTMCGNSPVTCRDAGGLMGYNPHRVQDSSQSGPISIAADEAIAESSATGRTRRRLNIDLLPAEYISGNNELSTGTETEPVLSGVVVYDLDSRIYNNPEVADKLALFRINARHRRTSTYTVSSVDGDNAFVNTYKPEEWIFESNFRLENRGYYASHVAAVQYELVARDRGFFGRLPSRIIRKEVVNGKTLAIMNEARKNNLPLKDIFLEKTPNGRSTRRIAELFGMEITQVTRPYQNDFHISLKVPQTDAQPVSRLYAAEKRGRFSVMRLT